MSSSSPFTRKRILRNRTIELDADRLHLVDERSSKKSRFPSHSPEPPTFQFPPLYSSQPQSSFTFLIRLFSSSLRSHPLQLLNEERAGEAFLPDAVDSYASPPALKKLQALSLWCFRSEIILWAMPDQTPTKRSTAAFAGYWENLQRAWIHPLRWIPGCQFSRLLSWVQFLPLNSSTH